MHGDSQGDAMVMSQGVTGMAGDVVVIKLMFMYKNKHQNSWLGM